MPSHAQKAFKDRKAPKTRKTVIVEMRNEGKAKDPQKRNVR